MQNCPITVWFDLAKGDRLLRGAAAGTWQPRKPGTEACPSPPLPRIGATVKIADRSSPLGPYLFERVGAVAVANGSRMTGNLKNDRLFTFRKLAYAHATLLNTVLT